MKIYIDLIFYYITVHLMVFGSIARLQLISLKIILCLYSDFFNGAFGFKGVNSSEKYIFPFIFPSTNISTEQKTFYFSEIDWHILNSLFPKKSSPLPESFSNISISIFSSVSLSNSRVYSHLGSLSPPLWGLVCLICFPRVIFAYGSFIMMKLMDAPSNEHK